MQTASLNMLVSIVDRGKGEGVSQLLLREGVMIHHIALGNGTAHKDLLSLLGLRDTAKDVVISFMQASAAGRALRRLSRALEIDLPGRGIAFTVPLGSVGGPSTLKYLMGDSLPVNAEEGEKNMSEQPKNDLIVTIVNRGYTDLVMDAARPVGARGGTVIHARGAGVEEASQFFGITIQPEKEMVLILVDHADKVAVMQAIVKGAGLNSEGHGIVFSLPVTDVMGVVRMTEENVEAQEQ